MKYEILKNIHLKESAKVNGVEMAVQKALSIASINRVSLFQAIE